jgi:hypothetical protein
MSKRQSCSSVIADKHTINELCKQSLKWIEDERDKMRNEHITALMEHGKFNLWGLIKRAPYTYEEAKAELEAEGWEGEYFWIDYKYSEDEKTFKRLVDAMQVSLPSNTTITLSTKDAQLIEVYKRDL